MQFLPELSCAGIVTGTLCKTGQLYVPSLEELLWKTTLSNAWSFFPLSLTGTIYIIHIDFYTCIKDYLVKCESNHESKPKGRVWSEKLTRNTGTSNILFSFSLSFSPYIGMIFPDFLPFYNFSELRSPKSTQQGRKKADLVLTANLSPALPFRN